LQSLDIQFPPLLAKGALLVVANLMLLTGLSGIPILWGHLRYHLEIWWSAPPSPSPEAPDYLGASPNRLIRFDKKIVDSFDLQVLDLMSKIANDVLQHDDDLITLRNLL
jgi:hypothetical protein